MMQTKKILSILLSMILLFSVCPTGVFDFTAGAETVSGTCGDNLTWEYDTSTCTLTISGTGAMKGYSSSSYSGTYVTDAPWRSYYDTMKTVIINSGVTSIGEYAFSGCTGLTSITIPDSVTSIGVEAFSGCTGLISITIGKGVIDIVKTGNGERCIPSGFGYHSELTSIIISEDNPCYSSEDGVLFNKDKTELIYCPQGKIGNYTIPNSVTHIWLDAFYNCTGLTSITFGSNVEIINDSFGGCTGLTSILVVEDNIYYSSEDGVLFNKDKTELIYCPQGKIGNYTIPNSVNNIAGSAFSGCTGITSITIPDSVTSIGNQAFHGCTGLTNITIPDSVTSIGGSAFSGCTGLTNITIPDSVTSVGEYAFYRCTGLTSITIPDSVTSIGGGAFRGCTGLTSILVVEDNPCYSSEDGVLFNKDKTELIYCPQGKIGEYTIPNSVTSIGDYAFWGCTGLTNITIPDSVTNIGSFAFYNTALFNNQPDGLVYAGKVAYKFMGNCPSSVTIKDGTLQIYDSAFFYCTGLTSITIPDSVTSIGSMVFYGCTGLTSITIPDSVTSIGDYAFLGCTGLTSVTIPNSVTSIGDYAFLGCTGLTSITIPDSVKSIGYSAFSGCTGLTNITIPDSVTSIGDYAFYNTAWFNNQPDGLVYAGKVAYKVKGNCPSSVTIKDGTLQISDSAFSGCTGLTSITIPDSVTSIGSMVFYGCTGLTSITIPDSVKSIGYSAFYGCTGLTNITIPDSVTSIGYCAFSGCTGLTNITIPDSVTSIGEEAFYDCSNLKTVSYCGTEEEWNKISIGTSNKSLTSASTTYNHDNISWQIQTPPTCIESGLQVRICPVCSKLLESETILPTGHTFDNWTVIIAFSCVTDGLEQRLCTVCGESETRTIPAHHTEQLLRTFEPTCTDGGYDYVRCTVCGTRYQKNFTDPIGHNYLLSETVSPTCTEGGYDRYCCDRCGDTYTDNLSPALGHNYQFVRTVNPTCTEQGYDLYRCERCEDTYNDNLTAALGHNYQFTRTVAATCINEGYHLYTCTRCGGENEIELPALGHYFVKEYCLDCGVWEKIAPYDINGDTELNAADLSVLVTGLLTDNKKSLYDCNGDGNVNILDLIKMKKQIASM